MSVELDRSSIEALITRVLEDLSGDFVLLGGALVALWIEPRRVTEDVDLVGLEGSNEERLGLMTVARELGFPIEAVNSAADYFLQRIPGWRDELEVYRRGTNATIYRPSPTLFVLLKMRRLCEQDLEDCLGMLSLTQHESLELDAPRLLRELAALPQTEDSALRSRRKKLREALEQTITPRGAAE